MRVPMAGVWGERVAEAAPRPVIQGAVTNEGTKLGRGTAGRVAGGGQGRTRRGHSQREGPEARTHNLLSLKENMPMPSVITKSKLYFTWFSL